MRNGRWLGKEIMDVPRVGHVEKEVHGRFVTVKPYWVADVDIDQPWGLGISVKAEVVPRLEAAMRAGVVFPNATIKTDVDGKTYVASNSEIIGKFANSQLKELGF